MGHNVYGMHIINIYHILKLNLLHLFVNTYSIKNQDRHLLIPLVNISIVFIIFHILHLAVYRNDNQPDSKDIDWKFSTIILDINDNTNAYNSFTPYLDINLNILNIYFIRYL